MEAYSQTRVQSVDILRGLVMVIMALDHVRDFFHLPALTDDPLNLETTFPWLFFTRWITHYCAPTFVFLSGVSARLAGARRTRRELSSFLIRRGLWLVFVEIVIITFGISFNPFYNVVFLQVIWAIGTSMILLGLLVRTSVKIIAICGIVLVFGHNITDFLASPAGFGGVVYNVLLTAQPSIYPVGENRVIFVMYAVLPWTGTMLLGYAVGHFFRSPIAPRVRKKALIGLGLAAVCLFILLRLINQYGDPSSWRAQENGLYSVLSFINTNKYPPSLLFLLMTLGPAVLLVAAFERWQNRITGFLSVYGRVPFFYYVTHFYLIHFLTVITFFATGRGVDEIADPNSPFFFRPVDFGFGLWIVYLIWIIVVLILYSPCLWFSRYKQKTKDWWLSYL